MKRRAFLWLGMFALSPCLASAEDVTHATVSGTVGASNALDLVSLVTPAARDVNGIAADKAQPPVGGGVVPTELSDGRVIVSEVYGSPVPPAVGTPKAPIVAPQPPAMSVPKSPVIPSQPPAKSLVVPLMLTTNTFWGVPWTTQVPVPTAGVPAAPLAPPPAVVPSVHMSNSAPSANPNSGPLKGSGSPQIFPTPVQHPSAPLPPVIVSGVHGSSSSSAMNPNPGPLTSLGSPQPLSPNRETSNAPNVVGGVPLVSTTFSFWGKTITTAWPAKVSSSPHAVMSPEPESIRMSAPVSATPMKSTTLVFWGVTMTLPWSSSTSAGSHGVVPLPVVIPSGMVSTTIALPGTAVTTALPLKSTSTRSGVPLPVVVPGQQSSKGTVNSNARSTSPSVQSAVSAAPAVRTSGIIATGTHPACGTRTMTDSTVGTGAMAAGTLWCTPPCNLIIPDYPLKTPSVITPSPLTTTITHHARSGTGSNGNVVLTTIITPKPTTISTASFFAQPITDCNQTSGVLVPQPVFAVAPSVWSTSIPGGAVISSTIVIPPYQPPASTCSSYSDCPIAPVVVMVCGGGSCPGGVGGGGGGGGGPVPVPVPVPGGCGLLCGSACPLPGLLSFLCAPWLLIPKIPTPHCVGPICNFNPPCLSPSAGCWLPFPKGIDPNIPLPNIGGPNPGGPNPKPGPPDQNPENNEPSASNSRQITTTSSSKSCTSGTTVTDIVVSCFTDGSTKFCENATSVTVTGCSITPTPTTTYLACPVLDPNEPQGDDSVPASLSSEFMSMFSDTGTITTTSSKSCSTGSVVTDILVSCFTDSATTFCANSTSITVTGCDITPTSTTTYLACPLLDPNDPQGDTSMPPSVSAQLMSLLSGAMTATRTASTTRRPSTTTHPSTTSTSTTALDTDTAGDLPVASVLSALWSEISRDHPVPAPTPTSTTKPDYSTCEACGGVLGSSSCAPDDAPCLNNDCRSSHDCMACPSVDCNKIGYYQPVASKAPAPAPPKPTLKGAPMPGAISPHPSCADCLSHLNSNCAKGDMLCLNKACHDACGDCPAVDCSALYNDYFPPPP